MPIEEELGKSGRRVRSKAKVGTGAGVLGDLFNTQNAQAVTLEWGDVDARYLSWLVVLITELGGAVTFGRSRDKGALMVTFLLAGERATTWIAPRDNAEDVLQSLGDRLATVK